MERVIFFFFHVVCLSVENEKSNKKSSSRFFSFVVLGLGFEKKQKRSAFPPSLCFVPKKTHTLSLCCCCCFSRGMRKNSSLSSVVRCLSLVFTTLALVCRFRSDEMMFSSLL